jgi:N6-L-threonylcarbamoyladenine synthase
MSEKRRQLRVPEGKRGLRQSDALFQHILELPKVLDDIWLPGALSAVCVSSRPRAVYGSYMPCFLAGLQIGKAMARAAGVPLFQVSHQQNHLAAAVLSSGRHELCKEPFYAWHISGGTTELLFVKPSFRAERIGGTTDISAGQIIDRVGMKMGLEFPCGPGLERLALQKSGNLKGHITVREREFSLSGLENRAESYLRDGERPEDVAYYVLRSIAGALQVAGASARGEYPALPLVCCGGVAANSIVREVMSGAVFAGREASADNAAGCAYLGYLLMSKIGKESAAWTL